MKLKILIFCLLTATINVSVAQKSNGKILIPAGVGNKVGFIDLKGKWIINPQFENVDVFQDNGLAGVELNGKWGWIDKTGKMVIEPKYDKIICEYDYCVFENDLAQVKLNLARVKLNDEEYYVDKNGNQIDWYIAESKYDGFAHNRKFDETDYIYGLVDRTGKTIIEPRFLHIGSFSNGLAPVKSNGYWDSDIYCGYGYIDTTGKMTIAAIYDDAESFTQNGLARVKIHGKWSFIDTTGKNVIEPQIYAFPFHGGFSILSDSIRVPQDYEDEVVPYMHVFGNVDSTGKIFEFDNKYVLNDFFSLFYIENGYSYHEGTIGGLFGVKFTEKWGFIDNQGMIVIKPQFDDIEQRFPPEPPIAVKINDKWGYIDRIGTFVIKPQFDYADSFEKYSYYGLDLAWVLIGNNQCLIDKSGKIFTAGFQQFYRIVPLHDGIIITSKINEDKESQEWGYISKKGKYKVIPTQNVDWLFDEGTNNISED